MGWEMQELVDKSKCVDSFCKTDITQTKTVKHPFSLTRRFSFNLGFSYSERDLNANHSI